MLGLCAGAIITLHAKRRYCERIHPGADLREAGIILRDATERATRTDERTLNGQALWSVDYPDMRLVTKHDPTDGMILVTVLAPAEPWEPEEVTASIAVRRLPPHTPKKSRKPSPGAVREAAVQAEAKAAKTARAAAHEARMAEQARLAVERRPRRASPSTQTDVEAKATAERRARAAACEANRARNLASGVVTYAMVRKAARQERQRTGIKSDRCSSAPVAGCQALLNGYVSMWRRAHDGAGLCRVCDEQMAADAAELDARATSATVATR